MNIPTNFGSNLPSVFREEDYNVKVYRRWWMPSNGNTSSDSLDQVGSGELNYQKLNLKKPSMMNITLLPTLFFLASASCNISSLKGRLFGIPGSFFFSEMKKKQQIKEYVN